MTIELRMRNFVLGAFHLSEINQISKGKAYMDYLMWADPGRYKQILGSELDTSIHDSSNTIDSLLNFLREEWANDPRSETEIQKL